MLSILAVTPTHNILTAVVGNMTREALKSASERLESLRQESDDGTVREIAGTQADQIAGLAEADRGPDHGRLARHMHALEELKGRVEPGQEEAVDQALEDLRAYRETVEGV